MLKTLSRIWGLVRPHKSKVVVIGLLGLVVAGCTALLPHLASLFFKDVLESKNAEYARWIPFSFPAIYLVLGLARYFHFTGVRYLSEVVAAELRKRLLDKLTRLNLTFHNSFRSGSGGMMSRFLNDTTVFQEGIYFAVDFIREPIIAVALLTQMFLIDWKLTLAALVCLPFIAIALRQVSKSLKKYGYLNREAMDDLTGTVKESLDGVRVIQSFNLEDEMSRRFDVNLSEYLRTRRKVINREEGVSPMNEFIVSLIFMGFAIYAINEVFGGRTSAGELTSFLLAAGLIQMPLKKIQNAHIRLQQTVVVAERIWQLLDSESFVPQAASPKPFPRDWKQIRFKDVSFAYGEEPVLQNVDITIHRGEIVALVGESGSGKSTIVNMLERFFDPTHGQILIDGVPLTDFDLKDLRRNIALVTQDVFLFRDSIERNIQAGDFSKDTSGVLPSAKLANAHNFIERTPQRYQSPVGDRGNFLSGGEKQRISIARAMFKDAPILILDEATSALDSVSELEVQKGLNHLIQGRTVFVIAHRLSTVYSATRILVLKKGQIVEHGTHDSLLEKRGEYYNFFQLQMAGHTDVV